MSASESVTEFFKLSLYEFVARFSESDLQWCATTEGDFWLGQPDVGFFFVAKDLFGLALDQLNVIHIRALVGIARIRSLLTKFVSDTFGWKRIYIFIISQEMFRFVQLM